MDLYQELEKVIDVFTGSKIPYALCGGVALAVHGIPRATDDIDLIVQEEDLEHIREAVRPIGFTLTSNLMTFRSGTEEEQTIVRITKAEGRDYLILDLLLASPALESAWNAREIRSIGDRKVSVIGRLDLIGMKERAGRPQDLADADKLKSIDADE